MEYAYRPSLSQVKNKDIRREFRQRQKCQPTWASLTHFATLVEMLRSYLEVGEYTFDLAVVFFGVSPILGSDFHMS